MARASRPALLGVDLPRLARSSRACPRPKGLCNPLRVRIAPAKRDVRSLFEFLPASTAHLEHKQTPFHLAIDRVTARQGDVRKDQAEAPGAAGGKQGLMRMLTGEKIDIASRLSRFGVRTGPRAENK